ncbi:hypothetical protein SLEP1_g3802 [Rubroshorea leprosula]|nr:hypothetical protein SLEP1_g3802 [Rubroshorea leprosula]
MVDNKLMLQDKRHHYGWHQYINLIRYKNNMGGDVSNTMLPHLTTRRRRRKPKDLY